MKKLVFTNYQIRVEENFSTRQLTLNDIKDFPQNLIHKIDDITYDIHFEIVENKHLWIYAKYGNPNPCPKDLFDEKQDKYLNNNRKNTQIEMTNQLFMLYSFEKQLMYSNNSKKRTFLEKLLREILNLNIIISSHYVNIDEFENRIKQLDIIKFKASENLLTQNAPLASAFKNYLNLDTNIDFTIEIKCRENGVSWLSNVLNNVKNAKSNLEIQDLMLIGKNEQEFEEIFNEGTFIKKFENYFNENEEGLYNSNDVLYYLINRITDV